MEGNLGTVPKWLYGFLECEYFSECSDHVHSNAKSRAADQSSTKKGDRNYYCVDCSKGPLCEMGLQLEHAGHYVLQVRKASHTDAIRISDVVKLLDISHIQTYTINGAKIVFLPSRPQAKPAKGAPRYCEMCHRSLQDQVRFCSLSCKLKAIVAGMSDPSLTRSAGLTFSAMQQKGGYYYQHAGEELSAMSEDTTWVTNDLLRPSSPSPATPAKKRARTSNKGFSTSSSMLLLQHHQLQEGDRPSMKNLKLRREHAPGMMMGMDDRLMPPHSPTSVLLHHDHPKFHMPGSSSPVSAGHESLSSHDSLEVVTFRKRSRKGVAFRAPGVGIIPVQGLYA